MTKKQYRGIVKGILKQASSEEGLAKLREKYGQYRTIYVAIMAETKNK